MDVRFYRTNRTSVTRDEKGDHTIKGVKKVSTPVQTRVRDLRYVQQPFLYVRVCECQNERGGLNRRYQYIIQ